MGRDNNAGARVERSRGSHPKAALHTIIMGKPLPPHSPEAGSDPRAHPSGMTQTLWFSEDRNECPLLLSLLEPSAFRRSLTNTVSGGTVSLPRPQMAHFFEQKRGRSDIVGSP